MNITVMIAFLFLTIPAFATPGPNNLMLMASGAKFGFVKTLPHMIGINIGFPAMVFLVGLGLSEIFDTYPIIKPVMKYLAAGYFLWMAWHLLGLKIGQQSGAARPMKLFEAVLFQWVNPKAWAMAVSFIAAFVSDGEGRLASLMLITLGCILVGPFFSFFWIYFGQQMQVLLVRTGGEKFLGAILAALMLVAVILFLV
ncbi:Transporter, LysE family [hydrothermal vent metagenome]|uniref:Transporter, LysE family n=1 Tax=hydrothermal vent metagenome TaxID=652676 RepID=A0A3B0U0E2_9ZZZZ